ncbi:MAG TPA: phosphoribosylanthranilate isomerase [Candidatus Hungatella pullicola]|nr:phosphoribosylanthranilate isomerase [Candidatus Hungatella pullicola]
MKKIKICGLTRKEEIEAVNLCLPDYAGFVFAPGRHQISPSRAKELKSILSPSIPAVGVFVNSPVSQICSLADNGVLDLIQLHGNENEDYTRTLKKLLPDIPVIRAFRILSETSEETFSNAFSYPSDYLLFDTFTKNQYGGSGLAFDWSLIPPCPRPYFLAGGIGISNVEQAAALPAFCLDISSSVETRGKKDFRKIQQIIEKVRSVS